MCDTERIDHVYGLLKDPDYTGKVSVSEHDTRFMCSECGKPIEGGRYGHMFVDSQHMIWCRSCRGKALEPCIRAVDKNPDDPHPKIYLRGGNYYQRLHRQEK